MRFFTLLIIVASATVASAQKNLFTVPLAEAVGADSLFVQQEFNFSDYVQGNTVFTRGLGNGFQAGINLMNLKMNFDRNSRIIPVSESSPARNPNLLLNAQQSFHLFTEALTTAIGTQAGINIADFDFTRFSTFTYVVSQVELTRKKIKVVSGTYFANKAYSGDRDAFGYMAGVVVPLIFEKLKLQADLLSGRNDLSALSLGFNWKITSRFSSALGYQITSPAAGKPNAVTWQLTIQ